MQFGEPKPVLRTFVCLTIVAVLLTGLVRVFAPLSFGRLLTLTLGLEGTFLLAFAFSASGLVPAQGSLLARVSWFFRPQGAVPVRYSPPLFYGGLIFLALSFILQVLTGS
jgi:hypothetical protein